jgi:hypothetical protein
LNANGNLRNLTLQVDDSGNMPGTPNGPVSGLWDEVSQKISFVVNNGGVFQSYTGFLFQDKFRMPGITRTTVFTLAGHFVDISSSANRPIFGWYAQISIA